MASCCGVLEVAATAPFVGVLIKRVDLRPAVDPLTGLVTRDPHGGLSRSDMAALELALQVGETSDLPVRCVTAGAREVTTCCDSLSGSAHREVLRVDVPADVPSDDVARAVAPHMASARFIFCGDYSLDRGSGSVPAFVAGHLDVAQALGAASVVHRDGVLHIERRLDRGGANCSGSRAPASSQSMGDSLHSGGHRCPGCCAVVTTRSPSPPLDRRPSPKWGACGRCAPDHVSSKDRTQTCPRVSVSCACRGH